METKEPEKYGSEFIGTGAVWTQRKTSFKADENANKAPPSRRQFGSSSGGWQTAQPCQRQDRGRTDADHGSAAEPLILSARNVKAVLPLRRRFVLDGPVTKNGKNSNSDVTMFAA